MFLGVDGGGTKTAFALLDASGALRATHEESGAYYLEVGMDGAAATLARGCSAVLAAAGMDADALEFAFFGLPAYGEDRAAQAALDLLPQAALGHHRYLCGNDMVCSWAGSLACSDGISVIAGTGSMAYGEYAGRKARAGGWGQLFSDEGSAYWIAREGLTLFSRMSDGRARRGPLHALVRQRFGLVDDLDLCGVVYGDMNSERSSVAQLARLVGEAARAGDPAARLIFDNAAVELADIVDAVRGALGVADGAPVRVSYTGGVLGSDSLLLGPFQRELAGRSQPYLLAAPQLAPAVGAALYAARCAGSPLDAPALARLAGAPQSSI